MCVIVFDAAVVSECECRRRLFARLVIIKYINAIKSKIIHRFAKIPAKFWLELC